MAPRRSKKFEGLDLDPVATVHARSLRSRTIKTETSPYSGKFSPVPISEPSSSVISPGDNTTSLCSRTVKTDTSPCSSQLPIMPISEPTIANGIPAHNTRILRSRTVKTDTSPCSGQLSIVPISEPSIANGIPVDNTRSLRSRTVKTDTSPCSGQLSIVPISEQTIANGIPGDNTRSLRSRTVKTDTSPCSGQRSIVPISKPTIANGIPGDNTRSLRSRKVKTDTSPCSGQLSVVPISEPSITNGTPGDNTRSLRSRTVKTETSPCSGQLSTVPISEPNIADRTPGDNTRSLRSRTVKTDTSPCSGQLSVVPISEPSIANGTPGDYTRSLRSRTVKTDTSPCSGQLSVVPISEPSIANGTPGDNARSLHSRTVKTETSPCSGQLSTMPISEPNIADRTPGDNTRSLHSHTIKNDTSPCSGQLSIVPISEPIIANGTPGDNIEEQVKLTEEGLPEDWIKEVKLPGNDLRRKHTFYVDPKTGYAFHSLEDALQYAQTGNILSCVINPQKRSKEEVLALVNSPEAGSPCRPVKTQTAKSSSQVRLCSDGLLPGDWIKEEKSRKKDSNKKYMFYIDPKTGYAFRSLKDALRYVETDDILSCASRPQQRSMEEIRILSNHAIDTESSASPSQPSNLISDDKSGDVCKVVQGSQLTSYGLPKSWIKELRPRKDGITMDPFYVDPDTGYAFLSLKDVSRYVATGNIRSCIVRPRKRSIEEVQALIRSSEISSITGMKTVKQESLQLVQLDSVHRKRKRSLMKPSDRKLKEDLKIKGDGATGIASQRVKKRKVERSCIRAYPRLWALKAKIMTDCDENHEENTHSCNTMHDASSQPDLKPEEEAMAENGSLTRTQLQSKILHKEGPMPIRASPRFAAPETKADISSLANKNGMMSKSVLEPVPSSQPCLNSQPSCHPGLEHEEIIERASGNSSGSLSSLSKKPSRRGKVHRERHTHLSTSCLSAQNVTNDATSFQNENSMMNNALFGPLSSLSYQNLRLSNQPDLELKEEIMERLDSSLMDTRLRRGKMRRGSSHLATMDVKNDGTSVENKNRVMNNAFLNQSPSFWFLNMTLASQPDQELKDKIQAANVISTATSSQRGEKQTERPMPFSTSSHQAALKRTTDCTYGETKDGNVTNSIFETRPPSHPDLNFGSTSLPDLELKEKQIQAANCGSTGTSLHIGKKHTERPMPLTAYSHQAAPKPTTDCTSQENEDGNVTNFVFERPPPSHPDLNLGSTSLPDMEVKEEVIKAANARGSRTILMGEKLLGERSATIINSSHLSTLRSTLGVTSTENHKENNKSYAVSELPLSPARPDLNFGPTSQPYREPMEDAIAAVNDSAIRTTSWRVEPRREVPSCLDASPHFKALKVTAEKASSKSNEKSSMATSALSEPSHYPGRPDLNLGPTSQLAVEPQKEIANDSTAGNPLWRRNLHGVQPTPVIAMIQAPCCNYENNIKRSNYFFVPVDSPASQINRGSTSQPNPGEVWHATTSAPSTVIAEGKNAPDLNMVPMSWSEPKYDLERALKTNPGPILEQQQQPVGVNTIGEFHLPVPSEMSYQDPTMDALLSGQEPSPSMPHMSIDALNSPVSPFFGDFWHDPCLSYAFRTLTTGVNQQGNPGLSPENNVNWTSTWNGGPSENPSIGSSGTTSRTPQYMNHGTPQYMNHGTPQYMNNGTLQYMNNGTPQYMNNGTPQYMNNGMPK